MTRSIRGQALLEAVFVTPVLAASLILLLGLCYLTFARAWLIFQTDRALLCAAEGAALSDCETSARSQLRKFLPFRRLKPLRLRAFGNDEWRAEVEWQWQTLQFRRKRAMKWDSSLWRQ